MKTTSDIIANKIPDFDDERDVFGQIKPKRLAFIKRFHHKFINAPDLNVEYASLWARSVATYIDMLIVISVLWAIEIFLFKLDFSNNEYNSYRIFIGFTTWILYNGILDSSMFQATVGKLILKLKVIDLHGNRISFQKASFRCFSVIFSILPVGFGLWCIKSDYKKRSLHDLISGTFVIKGYKPE